MNIYQVLHLDSELLSEFVFLPVSVSEAHLHHPGPIGAGRCHRWHMTAVVEIHETPEAFRRASGHANYASVALDVLYLFCGCL